MIPPGQKKLHFNSGIRRPGSGPDKTDFFLHTCSACARLYGTGGGRMAEKTETQTMIQNMKKGGKAKRIRENLLEELKKGGNLTEYYTDLTDDYISLWTTKELLKKDIEERGVRIRYDNGGGQKGMKKNESVEQLIKINAQMLKLLAELGITPSAVGYGGAGTDDDEL